MDDWVSRQELINKLNVSGELLTQLRKVFPVRWPRYYLDLVKEKPERDPIALMGRPDETELAPDPGAISDPVADQRLRPVPFVVRKHRDRIIVLTTKRCHFYCRFCFRREEPPARESEPNLDDWERIYAYVTEHPEIEEVILSGGDPLTLDDETLANIRRRLDAIPSLSRWRIHTRAPVHYPARLTDKLLDGLTGGKPLRIVAHFNHPAEITDETRRIADQLAACGIQFLNQAVLLNQVNNDPDCQFRLWRDLAGLGVGAHYLHHPDRVEGNARFRVTIEEGVRIYQALCERARFPLPRYVIDLPDGAGKVPVCDLQKMGADLYHFRHGDGRLSNYRDIAGDSRQNAGKDPK